jgi:hypothetical protein
MQSLLSFSRLQATVRCALEVTVTIVSQRKGLDLVSSKRLHLRLVERQALLLLLVLALLVHLCNLLLRRLVVAALLFEAASVVAVGGGVDVEEGAHLAAGLARGIVAVCGLLTGLEAASV